MIWIGKNTGIKILGTPNSNLINEESILFFGKNNSGKTRIFENLNIHSEQEYNERHNVCFVINSGKANFIKRNGELCKIKRHEISRTKINKWNMWSLIPEVVLNSLIPKVIAVPNNKLAFEPKFFFYFPYTINELKGCVSILKATSKNWTEKEKKEMIGFLSIGAKFMSLKIGEKVSKEKKEKISQFLILSNYFTNKFREEIIKIESNGLEYILGYIVHTYEKHLEREVYEGGVSAENATIKIKIRAKFKKANLLKEMIQEGESYGIKKYNTIINNLCDGLKNNVNAYIYDDPFEGLDLSNVKSLASVFAKMINDGFKIIIFTSDINALRFLKQENSKLKTCLLQLENGTSYIEELIGLENIFFKYHDKNYYYDIVNFLKDPMTLYEVAQIIVAAHRQQIYEAKNIIKLIDGTESVVEKINDIYIKMTNTIKAKKTKILIHKDIKKSPNSFIYAYSSNYFESKIFHLVNGSTSDFINRRPRGTLMFVGALAKIATISIVDALKKTVEDISSEFENYEFTQIVKIKKIVLKKIKEHEKWRNDLVHCKEHVFIWAYICDPIPITYLKLLDVKNILERGIDGDTFDKIKGIFNEKTD